MDGEHGCEARFSLEVMEHRRGDALLFYIAALAQTPKPTGKLVQLEGRRIHIHCTGKGQPTVVIENGFDEFSFDWMKVQAA